MKKTPLALMIALALQQFPAHADSNDQAMPTVTVGAVKETPYNPVSATSATKIDAPLRDIPQTVNVVPQTLLRDQGAHSMQDAMKAVPGIGLSHGDGQRDQITIRGFSALGDQFIDGMRDDAMYFRDLSNVEQIEVLKGPASVLYGRGSSGGLVNRITKKPGIDKTEVSLTIGSWSQKRGEIDLARNFDDQGVAFRVTGAKEDANSFRDQQFLKREAFSPSVLFKLTPDTTLLLQAEYIADRRVTDFGIPAYKDRAVDVDPSTYYGAANARDFDYSQSRVTSFGMVLNHRINDTLTLRNALRQYDYKLDRNNTLVGSVNEAAKTASLNRSNVKRAEDGIFNQTELVQKAVIGGMPHQILYGVEFGKQNKDQLFRSQNNVATVDLFHPVAPKLPFTVTAAPSTDNLGILTVSSAYVQDLATLTPEWKALVGARFDKFKQETEERRAGQANLSRTDRAWSPRAGLVYQPRQDQSYYLSYSKSFQPSAESLPLAANAANIEPEETSNKEIGAKFDFFGGRASATASLYQLERSNIKSTDPVSNKLIPIGTQKTNGLELSFTGDLGQGWQVFGGYAYMDAEVSKSIAKDDGQFVQGKRPTLTPKQSMNLWVSKALGGGFSAGAGVNYVADRFANPGNTVTLPSYVTADAMLSYRVRGLDLQLNINNLFDRNYIAAGHGSSKLLNLPGAPRNVQLTARYNF
ncbi:TonB-dependent siderophore receptor [Massilia sp. NR 4-1]|uniref:TonB-dependent receptor n=1 Tax=Massilia sp. NR 4-1 TaxID=1678028 RepID=UPI00067BA1A4|nr:TonB-dependent siderophore receptor [Massilia sp. NR 4-1]AKU22111.1 TonB-dependent receptor [Massilia sp. NR 4-1]